MFICMQNCKWIGKERWKSLNDCEIHIDTRTLFRVVIALLAIASCGRWQRWLRRQHYKYTRVVNRWVFREQGNNGVQTQPLVNICNAKMQIRNEHMSSC